MDPTTTKVEHQPRSQKFFYIVCAKDQNFKPFSVKVDVDDTVVDLAEKIVAADEPRFRKLDIAAPSLDIFKAKISIIDILEGKVNALGAIQSAIEADPLLPMDHVHFQSPESTMVYFIAKSPDCNPNIDLEFITFRLVSQSHYHTLDETVLGDNDISFKADFEPFVEFQSKLERKRNIQHESEYLTKLRQQLGSDEFARHFQFEAATSQSITDPLDLVGDVEAEGYVHLQQANCLYDLDVYVTGNKEAHLAALLWPLVTHKYRQTDPVFSFQSRWVFPLVAEIPGFTKKYKVNPISSAQIRVGALPYMILEVASNSAESDRYRMLLQASCLTKVGGHLSTNTTKPFVVTAIYIDDKMRASRYLVCKDSNSSDVYYCVKRFNLTTKAEAFDFVFELFNLAGQSEEQSQFLRALKPTLLARQVNHLGLSSIPTKPFKRKHPDRNKKASPGKPDQITEGGLNEMDEAIEGAGYSLIIESDSDELRSLPILPDTMRKAETSDGSRVVAKYIDDESSEVEILQYLQGLKGVEHHIIELLNVIPLIVGSLIIVPHYLPLPLTMSNLATPGAVVSVQEQLIEGVRFMHQHGVAHRDLKPDNLVVKLERKPAVFIIDFDCAIRVEGVETMIKGQYGTKDWMAPEMFTGEKYSPILADLWSCGKMIAFIGQFMRLTPKMGELSHFGNVGVYPRKVRTTHPDKTADNDVWESVFTFNGSSTF
ncbi:signal transducing kinase of the PAK [Serendipita sp. 399]|nr:signal transducing kinase of the PAK [Serendipita sp. 399]